MRAAAKCQVFIMRVSILFSWNEIFWESLNHASGRRETFTVTYRDSKGYYRNYPWEAVRGVFSHVLKLSTALSRYCSPKYRNVECAIWPKSDASYLNTMTVDFLRTWLWHSHLCTLWFYWRQRPGFWPCFSEAPGQQLMTPNRGWNPIGFKCYLSWNHSVPFKICQHTLFHRLLKQIQQVNSISCEKCSSVLNSPANAVEWPAVLLWSNLKKESQ